MSIDIKTAKKNETIKQKYNKEYADNKRNVKGSSIKIGDYVLVRQDKQNKLTPNSNKTPYVVTHTKHTLELQHATLTDIL